VRNLLSPVMKSRAYVRTQESMRKAPAKCRFHIPPH
jgi:hypothetical protein